MAESVGLGRDNFGDTGIDGRIIIKFMLKEVMSERRY